MIVCSVAQVGLLDEGHLLLAKGRNRNLRKISGGQDTNEAQVNSPLLNLLKFYKCKLIVMVF